MDQLVPLLAELAAFARAHPWLVGGIAVYVLASNVLSHVPPLYVWPVTLGGRTVALPVGMLVHGLLLNVGHILRKLGEASGSGLLAKFLGVLFPAPPVDPPAPPVPPA